MPDANGSQQVGATPPTPSPTQAPLQTGSDQNPPPPPANPDANQQDTRSKDLQDIKRGEIWLIGIGIASVVVNVFLGVIYYLQLGQMRVATNASAEATRLASDSLQYSASQFDRSMAQITTQTATQYRSTGAAESAARAAEGSNKIATSNFHLEQRAYLVPMEPIDEGGFGLLKLPIRNYGHIAARQVTLQITYRRNSTEGNPMPIVDRRVFRATAARAIPPGDVPTFVWDIFVPTYTPQENALISTGRDVIHVDGVLSYDTGFGEKDSIGVCYFFQRIRNRWEGCSQSQTVWLNDTPNTHQ